MGKLCVKLTTSLDTPTCYLSLSYFSLSYTAYTHKNKQMEVLLCPF